MNNKLGIAVLAGLVGAAILALFVSGDRDPVYRGTHLREILRDESMWHQNTCSYGKRLESFESFYRPREREYFRALHCMGEKAWPVLLSELQAQDSELKLSLRRIVTFPRLFRIDDVPSFVRREGARAAIEELIFLHEKRSGPTMDPAWRGLEEFPPSSRRRVVMDLTTALKAHLDNLALAEKICLLLEGTGTNADAAIPALEDAVRAGIPRANSVLEEIRWEQKKDGAASQ